MYFLVGALLFCARQLTHTILLHPSYFGAQLEEYLRQKLYEDVEGSCNSKYGFIISVVTINDIGEGKIMPSTGQARFKCSYTAIVMKPFKGEVVDGKVSLVNKVGFCVQVGPLTVFISSLLLNADLKFDDASALCYRSADELIQKGTKVRCEIVGSQMRGTNDMFAVGTMKKDYLGQIHE